MCDVLDIGVVFKGFVSLGVKLVEIVYGLHKGEIDGIQLSEEGSLLIGIERFVVV